MGEAVLSGEHIEDESKIPKDPFCQTAPKLQLAWDSVSMERLQSCPRKYELSNIEGWAPKKMAPSLEFGILFHKAMEHHQKLLGQGADPEEALQDTTKYTLGISKGFEGDKGEEKGGYRTRFTLLRTVIWYIDRFKSDPLKVMILLDEKPAVELSFRIAAPLISPDGVPYILCGHIDKVDAEELEVLVHDYKTTIYTLDGKFFRKFSPNWQISNYIFAGSVMLPRPPKGAIIDAAQIAKGFSRFLRGKVDRTPRQMREWLDNTLHWIKLAEGFAEKDYWPMNEFSCHVYGGCHFREICSMDPATRELFLKSNFKRERWNPLENRGD
jgi:hypothetical protein